MTPTTPQANRQIDGRWCSTVTARNATMIGCAAPSVAATPPGRRSAATKSSGKNTPMFSTPRTAAFASQVPCRQCAGDRQRDQAGRQCPEQRCEQRMPSAEAVRS